MKYDMNFLRKNPIFFSRLGFGYDPSMRGKNGKVVSFTNDPDKFGRFHKMFADAGVNLHTCILNAGCAHVIIRPEFENPVIARV